MRERINRLAKGIVDAEIPEVLIQPETCEGPVTAGQVCRKELYVTDRYGCFIKGLVYSSHPRVRVLGTSFGGNRNRIFYEVDCRTLSDGDKIEGVFDLVTNGGEKKLPYSFVVEPDPVGKILAGLKTAETFAKLVQCDSEFAKRLFDYRDFTDAPFMQDLQVRALYDGLKGKPNRQNELEEFLVGLHAKKPVELSVDTSLRSFENPEQNLQGTLLVECSTWGYIRLEAETDGEFIILSKAVFTDADFQDGVCEIPYRIDPAHLHQGKNLGAVWISTMRQQICVPFEVLAGDDGKDRSVYGRREAFGNYLELRLEYELGLYGEALMRNQLKQQLELIRSQYGESLAVNLYQADLFLLEGDTEAAKEVLGNCREEAASVRKYRPEYEQLHQYLSKQLQPVKEEETGAEEEGIAELREEFERGSRSPYLYVRVWELYQNHPELFTGLSDFELQVLMFAAKRKLVDKTFALKTAELAVTVKRSGRLLFRLLTMLYRQYPEPEILNAICSILIKTDCRDKKYFTWYQKALNDGVSLTRLYEYYLYALPEDYPYLLPKEVLLYFSYEKSMDTANREVLYSNIVKFMNPDSSLYRQYERDIEQFTMEQLLRSRVNSRLVTLYQHVLYKEMIDEQVAKVFPAILKSYRITVSGKNIRSVVVCYEELEREDVFPVKDGIAYAPLFSSHPVLLFEDACGNRYSNVSYRKQQAMMTDQKELEERCYEICPEQPMLLLERCSAIVQNGMKDALDRRILKRTLKELHLHPLFQEKLLACLIGYDSEKQETEENMPGVLDYLTQVNAENLSHEERAKLLKLLICQDNYVEAFSLIQNYGYDGADKEELLKLCSRMILNQMPESDDTLLGLSWNLFSQGEWDGALLDYLCEHFNGTSEQMYQMLEKSEEEHVELYDLPERLLAQMMFSGETKHIDPVFACYRKGKRVSELVTKAYFTMKSADYFLKNCPTTDAVFAYLEETVKQIPEKKRIPTIYMLALTLWYSRKESLSEEQEKLARGMVDQLLEEGRIFAYFHQLGQKIPMPDSIMDQITIEYRGSREVRPELKIRVLPVEENSHNAEFIKVYPGIYIHQHVLFEGEVLEYEVYENVAEERSSGDVLDTASPCTAVKKDGGRLSYDSSLNGGRESRFTALNDMSRCLMEHNTSQLKEKMEKYLTDHAAMESLFTLM
ncbi:DUF5717 family protein [Clostridium sp. AF32-12BH]|uniref:DUF5717 family protein n=1 Tax=Clostridium sp. AF32-12BH TaxID=2292006 RepID=UPI000E4DFADB|nr:DUF5717 family protein [Clostridium sp. AF32-12BH]RHP44115.1 hypothetical protein DWZ40_15195 [Clostridium sp. AF32-12BH]